MSFSIVIPMRSGSTRSIRKNTRPFLESGESLFQLKMHSIQRLSERDDFVEVIISSDDEEVFDQAKPYLSDKVKIDIRPKNLCLSSTKVVDLINYIPKITKGRYIFWLHVTSPFVVFDDYLLAINKYQKFVIDNKVNDSLMSVNKINQFIWSDKEKRVINVNRDINPWPNTQDLDPIYEINHAFYISSRENYMQYNDRIGVNPYLFLCEGLRKIDVDWEDDFIFAQKLAGVFNGF